MSDDQQQQEQGQEESAGIASLRKAHDEAVRKNAELQQQLADFQAAQRAGALKDVFGDLKVRPALATFYPADADTSKEAVEKWARENAEAFGLTFDDQSPAVQEQHQQVAAAQQQQAAASANSGKSPLEVGTPEERDKLIADNDPVWLMEQGLIPDIRPFA